MKRRAAFVVCLLAVLAAGLAWQLATVRPDPFPVAYAAIQPGMSASEVEGIFESPADAVVRSLHDGKTAHYWNRGAFIAAVYIRDGRVSAKAWLDTDPPSSNRVIGRLIDWYEAHSISLDEVAP